MRISKHLNGNTFREGVGGKQLIMHILPLSLYLCNAPASSYNTVVLKYIRPRLSAAGSGAEAIRLDSGEIIDGYFDSRLPLYGKGVPI